MKKYFRRRNGYTIEYSGHGEVSKQLRERIAGICAGYLSKYPQNDYYLNEAVLEHELFQEFNKSDIYIIIHTHPYQDVFTVVEMFIDLSREHALSGFSRIFSDFSRAFELSGSVYFVNASGEVNLRIDEDTAQKLEEVKSILKENESAYGIFFSAVGGLLGRKEKPENTVKDIFVAFEGYLKQITGEKDCGKAINKLHKEGIITQTQKAILEKLYAYRSDSYGSAHAGNSKTPDEIDALWFIETVVAQLKLIDNRVNKND